jgi:hypothetical protein
MKFDNLEYCNFRRQILICVAIRETVGTLHENLHACPCITNQTRPVLTGSRTISIITAEKTLAKFVCPVHFLRLPVAWMGDHLTTIVACFFLCTPFSLQGLFLSFTTLTLPCLCCHGRATAPLFPHFRGCLEILTYINTQKLTNLTLNLKMEAELIYETSTIMAKSTRCKHPRLKLL